MTLIGWTEILLVLALLLGTAWLLGALIADVFDGRRNFLSPIVGSLERSFYRRSGVAPQEEQSWLCYTLSMFAFAAGCFLTFYGFLRLQALFPFNPEGRDALAPDLAFNTAISFITNANWQAYAGETTLSQFTQMAGLSTPNFLYTAMAMALAVGLTRVLARSESETIGNFWVDMARAAFYVLLSISIPVALTCMAFGVLPQLIVSTCARRSHLFERGATPQAPNWPAPLTILFAASADPEGSLEDPRRGANRQRL
jgi:potassium-transporting ATPase potassium-binding subunit